MFYFSCPTGIICKLTCFCWTTGINAVANLLTLWAGKCQDTRTYAEIRAHLSETRDLKTARDHIMPPPLHLSAFRCKLFPYRCSCAWQANHTVEARNERAEE